MVLPCPFSLFSNVTGQPMGSSKWKSDHILCLLNTPCVATLASREALCELTPLTNCPPASSLTPPPLPPTDPQPCCLLVIIVSQNSHAPSWHKGFAHVFLLGWNILPPFPLWLKGTTSCLPRSVECQPQEGRAVPAMCHRHISGASQTPTTRGRPKTDGPR